MKQNKVARWRSFKSGSGFRWPSLVLFSFLLLEPCWAQRPPARPLLPAIDKRHETPPTAAAAAQKMDAAATLRQRVPALKVEFDPLTGSAMSVSSVESFLTGPDGKGATISAASLTKFAVNDPDRVTKAFLNEHRALFGHGPEALAKARVNRDYVAPNNGLHTVIWEQQVDGIAVFEGVLISHTTKNGELVNLSSHFLSDPDAAATLGTPNRVALVGTPAMSAVRAVTLAAQNVGVDLAEANVVATGEVAGGAEQRQKFKATGLKGETEAKLIWLPMSAEKLRLCWDVTLMNRQRGEMFRVLLDMESGEVLVRRCLTSYLTDATYNVFTNDSPTPFSPGWPTPNANQPTLVSRTLVTLPALDTNASPAGWINDGGNETWGNNVDAHADRNADNLPDLPRPQGSPFRVFNFPMDLTTQDPTNYTSAAIVQLFYLCNWYHDKLYALGFTEAAGNFQSNNFARGGVGNDAVQADAQDGSGTDNANFSTPADGSPGRMQMYIFTGPAPRRDGDLDAEIVLHEHTHGLSWRLVGGGQALGDMQSNGMGEGWSDFYGLSLLSQPGDDVNGVYASGAYASYKLDPTFLQNYYFGIRRYPYTTDMTKNPLTFNDIDPAQINICSSGAPYSPVSFLSPCGGNANEVHNEGEVWCVTLWEARANLINKYGWAVGNQLILQLVTDGMKLTVAHPNFLQARDGILQADLVDTGGANRNELWAAFAKRGMGFSATSPASSTTTGVHESFDLPDDLRITPATDLNSYGQMGGTFSPACQTYSFRNAGSNMLTWVAYSTQPWVGVAPTSGNLPAGVSNAVNLCLTTAANTLTAATYTASVVISNTTSGVSQTRNVTLTVVPPRVAFFSLDTDPGWPRQGQWSFGHPTGLGGTLHGQPDPANGATGTNVFGVNLNGDYSTNVAGPYYLTAGPFDFTGRTGMRLQFQRWLNTDYVPFAYATLEFSTNNTTWTKIWTNSTSEIADSAWARVGYDLPATVNNQTNVYVRWGYQIASGAWTYSGWNIDDIEFLGFPSQSLTITVPASTTEGAGTLVGSVTASSAQASDVVVVLASSDSSEIILPATVTILAGQTNATFSVFVQDDLLLDGSQPVVCTASASGWGGSSATILVHDNEPGVLQVTLPATATEWDVSVLGTVSVNGTVGRNVTVSLTSSDLSEIQVPATVVIPLGQTSVVFTATVMDDTLIDGPQTATVTAQVQNWTSGTANITVLDNENLNLTLTLPASATEGDGVLTNAGRVWISGTLPTNLVVTLSSSNVVEVTVPASATIPAGQLYGAFNLSIGHDPAVTGNQLVAITARVPGFVTGAASLVVSDYESPVLPANPTPANLASYVAANTSLSWMGGSGDVTNEVYFGTNPAPGPAQLVGITTTTIWTLPLLAPNTTYYWQIVSHRGGTTAGPVWQFTTRGVNHFVWNSLASPQFRNMTIGVTVTARDEFDTVVTNFAGPVGLSGGSGSSGLGQLVSFDDLLGSSLPVPVGYGGLTWTNFIYLIGTNSPNSGYLAGTVSPPSVVFNASGTPASIISTGPVNLVSAFLTAAWNDNLQVQVKGYAGANLIYSNSFFLSATVPTLINFNYLGVTKVDFVSSGGTPHSGYSGSGTQFVMDNIVLGGSVASLVSITPTNSGAFADGSWTGNVTVQQLADSMYLRADDGLGHTGNSTNFAVLAQNDLVLSMTAAPNPVLAARNWTNLITVANTGPGAATGIVVTNIFPTSAAFVSATASQGSYSLAGNVVTFDVGSLSGGVSATFNVVVAPSLGGTVTNIATVSRAEADGEPTNNFALTTTLVQLPTLTINSVSVLEGNSGFTPLTFTVQLLSASPNNITVNYTTADGTAQAGSDYVAASGLLTFLPGQTNQTITIQVIGDTSAESSETFSVVLSNPVNAAIGTATGTGTILDDDVLTLAQALDTSGWTWLTGGTNIWTGQTTNTHDGVDAGQSGVITDNQETWMETTVQGPGSVTFWWSVSSESGYDYLEFRTNGVIATRISGTVGWSWVSNVVASGTQTLRWRYMKDGSVSSGQDKGWVDQVSFVPTTGVVHHFAWGSIIPTQPVSKPFPVSLTALDSLGNKVTNFTGTVALSGRRSGSNVLFAANFDTGLNGFSYVPDPDASSNLWHSTAHRFVSPTNCLYYGLEGSWTYDTGARNAGNVQSPVISLAGAVAPVTLSFNYLLQTEGGTTWDQASVLISANGGATWNALVSSTNLVNPLVLSPSFTNRAVDISAYAGNNILLRFNFDTIDGTANSFEGWYVDDVVVAASTAAVAINPTNTSSFTNGVWTGNVAVLEMATNLYLSATDSLGHSGSSNPFQVVSNSVMNQVTLLPGGTIQITLAGSPGDVYRVLGSTNLVDWQTIASVTNVTGTVQFTDPTATNYNRRFYRLVMP